MPYNMELEQRLDRFTDRLGKFTKKKMFGGICYLMNGNMVFGIHRQSLVIRTSTERAEELLKGEHVSLFDMTGRPMKGWLLISPNGLETEEKILELLNLCIEYVSILPKKVGKLETK